MGYVPLKKKKKTFKCFWQRTMGNIETMKLTCCNKESF